MNYHIGIDKATYPVVRNITSLHHEQYSYNYRLNIFRIPNKLKYLVSGKINPVLLNLYAPLSHGPVQFYHHFNQVNISSRPFITTFETSVPYWTRSAAYARRAADYGIRQIADKRCIALIAISHRAEKLQKKLIEEYYPEYRPVLDKLVHIPPPQTTLFKEIADKPITDDKLIRFTIVGSQFFTKGGYAILQTFSDLFDEGLPIHLTIISTFNDPGVPTKLRNHYYSYLEYFLKKHASRITYYPSLPNDQVLDILKTTDIGLLPSVSESYGYSVLEQQAAGCPVITTDIEALKETNNSECGWIIELPEEWQNSNYNLRNMDKVNNIIYPCLSKMIRDIVAHPEQIRIRGMRSFERIRQCHDPDKIANRIEKTYREALHYG